MNHFLHMKVHMKVLVRLNVRMHMGAWAYFEGPLSLSHYIGQVVGKSGQYIK